MSSKMIMFRANSEDSKILTDAAAASHLNLSAWIRQTCLIEANRMRNAKKEKRDGN